MGQTMSLFGSAVNYSAAAFGYNEIMLTRAFATAHLPFNKLKSVVAMSQLKFQWYLFVVAADGFMYIYKVDTSNGGECELVKQHQLDVPQQLDSPKRAAAATAAGKISGGGDAHTSSSSSSGGDGGGDIVSSW